MNVEKGDVVVELFQRGAPKIEEVTPGTRCTQASATLAGRGVPALATALLRRRRQGCGR
ncbi:MAG: hypothetical protein R3C24_18270 [Cyanobacteriota/Melainabacteria group bacterium]